MPAPFLVNAGKLESDFDCNFFRLINLDTSNLPPSGIPPTIHPNPSFWLHDWDAGSQTWTATRPKFSDLQGILTFDQQNAITAVGTIAFGVWEGLPIEPLYAPTLDAIRSPVDNVSMAGKRIRNLADPIDATDAVNKQFMDLLLQGLNPKQAVRVATTVDTNPSGLQTIDGVALHVGDRVLIKNDTTRLYFNGIWVVATGSWTRATDADHGSGDTGFNSQNSIDRGCYCVVLEGTQAGTSWFQKDDVVHCDINPTGDDIEFVIFAAPLTVTAGQGLGQIGNTVFVNYTAHRTAANGDAIDIATDYVGQGSITTLGTITSGSWHATPIRSDFGGTGNNNGTNGITLEAPLAVTLGPLATSSTLELLVQDGATSILLPTTGTLATLANAELLQNKRIEAKYQEIASNSFPAINTNLVDVFAITNLAVPINSMTTALTGNPLDGETLVIWLHDNGVSRTITWGPKFVAGSGASDPTLPIATVTSKWTYCQFTWLKQLSQWVLTGKVAQI